MDIEKRNPTVAERSERASAEYRRLANQEKFILEVTEALLRAIEENGLTWVNGPIERLRKAAPNAG